MIVEVRVPQIERIQVTGLLGEFNHEVEFPSAWPFVIVHGPNGVGKTHLLKLIQGLFTRDLEGLLSIPFAGARAHFDDGSEIELVHEPAGTEDVLPGLSTSELERVPELVVKLWQHGELIDTFTTEQDPQFGLPPRVAMFIDRELPFLSRIGPSRWVDERVGRPVTSRELARMLPTAMQTEIRQMMRRHDTRPAEVESAVLDFLGNLKVHLIETQRLSALSDARGRDRGDAVLTPTVRAFASDLTHRLNFALAQNSRRSQLLDRSFPRRLLERDQAEAIVTDELIREKYQAQSELRARLAEIAVLDAADDLPLPSRQLADWERLVLWNYLDDTEEKLGTFKEILEKINLIVGIVNSRFLNKEMGIDPELGFVFRTSRGVSLSPENLSSGEQHELVLLYDLLFNVEPGTLVLIDEPEISLHIGWQQKFLADVSEIARLTSLRFIVATHSPQIIHKWWDYAQALGPDEIHDV